MNITTIPTSPTPHLEAGVACTKGDEEAATHHDWVQQRDCSTLRKAVLAALASVDDMVGEVKLVSCWVRCWVRQESGSMRYEQRELATGLEWPAATRSRRHSIP